ncbi:MAG: ribonuclease HII [Candidatus Pacebacteria bacterium]|jgi:ribonuclease HII|nr:ribonuclease HII [Candidatus Paceibacterota bacterium]
MSKHKYLIGVDEVGRGPLAGPVAVGAVCIYVEHKKKVENLFPIVKDSKKLTPQKREAWLLKIKEAETLGYLSCAVSFVAPSVIDKKGLPYAIRTAMAKSLEAIEHNTEETKVLLDGSLYAPEHYQNQETIIKGDEKELSIALASIVAKVARDAKMTLLAKKLPEYGFEKHKGYGTRGHYDAIRKNGITKHHRKSFLKGLV